MSVISKNVWFDDAATSAMGQAFDRACKSLGNFDSISTVRDQFRRAQGMKVFSECNLAVPDQCSLR